MHHMCVLVLQCTDFATVILVPEEGLSLASHLAAARLGLGTASLLGLLASHRSGVLVLPRSAQALRSPAQTLTAFVFVPEEGLEPSHLSIHDFESCASAIPPLRQ